MFCLLVSCSSGNTPPDVAWGKKYAASVKEDVDRYAKPAGALKQASRVPAVGDGSTGASVDKAHSHRKLA